MKRLFAVLFFALAAHVVQGQTPQTNEPVGVCTLSKPPELRGLRLGMSLAEVKARFPELEIPTPNEFGYGVAVYSVSSLTGVTKAQLDGVSRIAFGFLDEKVNSLTISYQTGFTWKNADEFIALLSAKLKLPRSWYGSNEYNKELQCNGFKISANTIGNNASVTFSYPSVEPILKKRQAEKEQKLRQAFKL